MALVQIRNVPEDVRRVLKARAAAQGASLNAYLLEMISREVERPTAAEVFARAAARASRSDVSTLEYLDAARGERDAELSSP